MEDGMQKIEPCPHCGGEVIFWQDSGGRGTGGITLYSARCKDNYNDIILATDLGTDGTKRSAIRSWDRKAKRLRST